MQHHGFWKLAESARALLGRGAGLVGRRTNHVAPGKVGFDQSESFPTRNLPFLRHGGK
jgi:hypothetical protein